MGHFIYLECGFLGVICGVKDGNGDGDVDPRTGLWYVGTYVLLQYVCRNNNVRRCIGRSLIEE